MVYYTVGLVLVAFLSGYVLGRKHRREAAQELLETGKATWLVRPHTEKTLQHYPLPEETEDPSTIVEGQWSRTNLPNSGVRWS